MSWQAQPAATATQTRGQPASGSSQGFGTPVDGATLAILRNADFQSLVKERTAFGWMLSAAMLLIYLGFIFLVAFDKDLMAMKVGDGELSLGIVLGLCVIISAIVLTGIYVWRANGRFDDLTRDLRRTESQ